MMTSIRGINPVHKQKFMTYHLRTIDLQTPAYMREKLEEIDARIRQLCLEDKEYVPLARDGVSGH
jgi:adenylosuccinate synthase